MFKSSLIFQEFRYVPRAQLVLLPMTKWHIICKSWTLTWQPDSHHRYLELYVFQHSIWRKYPPNNGMIPKYKDMVHGKLVYYVGKLTLCSGVSTSAKLQLEMILWRGTEECVHTCHNYLYSTSIIEVLNYLLLLNSCRIPCMFVF